MSTSGAGAAKRSKTTNILLTIAVACVALVVLVLFTLMFGHVTGTEFAPHSFETRTYYVLRIPLVNLQVWPIQRTSQASDLVTHLFGADKILVKGKAADPEFDLVEEMAGAKTIKGDARFLQKYLEGEAEKDLLKWTKEKPELAKVFWPEVQRVANRRVYMAIPEMFYLARQYDTPEELKKAVHEHLAGHYLLLGQAEYEQSNVGPAIVLLEEAKSYAPENQEIEKLLSEVKSKAEQKPAKG